MDRLLDLAQAAHMENWAKCRQESQADGRARHYVLAQRELFPWVSKDLVVLINEGSASDRVRS